MQTIYAGRWGTLHQWPIGSFRGTRIALSSKLRPQALALAYEEHLGITGTNQNFRTKVYWSGMDKAAQKHCKSCHGCQLVAQPNPPGPIRSTALPDAPWQHLAADLMGPFPSGHSILVDCLGRRSRLEERIAKVRYEVQRTSSDRKSPAELMFNRRIKGKLPDLNMAYHRNDLETRDRDAEQKSKMKSYADQRRNAKVSGIEVGDKVLLKQDKSDKFSTTFEPDPYSVISKNGSNVVLQTSGSAVYSRNSPTSRNTFPQLKATRPRQAHHLHHLKNRQDPQGTRKHR